MVRRGAALLLSALFAAGAWAALPDGGPAARSAPLDLAAAAASGADLLVYAPQQWGASTVYVNAVNDGPDAAASVVLRVTGLGNYQVVAQSNDCHQSGSEMVCSDPSWEDSHIRGVTHHFVFAFLSGSGSVTLTASVSSATPDPVSSNNSATSARWTPGSDTETPPSDPTPPVATHPPAPAKSPAGPGSPAAPPAAPGAAPAGPDGGGITAGNAGSAGSTPGAVVAGAPALPSSTTGQSAAAGEPQQAAAPSAPPASDINGQRSATVSNTATPLGGGLVTGIVIAAVLVVAVAAGVLIARKRSGILGRAWRVRHGSAGAGAGAGAVSEGTGGVADAESELPG